MRLATFTERDSTRIGVVTEDRVIDLSRLTPDLPRDMVGFLTAGTEAAAIARSAQHRADASIPLEDVHLEAPVLRPRKFMGIGVNYPRADLPAVYAQALERGDQIWFNKQVTCVNGPFDPIELPTGTKNLIHEAELAIVIGRQCRHVSEADARHAIAGYVVCNDVTVVDWVLRSPTATLGKSFDTHGPIGPWIVTADELKDPHDLGLRGFVNGTAREAGHTSQMLFDCFEIVAYLSQVFTLEPGDILTTGTPARLKEPLRTGDVVRCEVDGIGYIENRIVAEA